MGDSDRYTRSMLKALTEASTSMSQGLTSLTTLQASQQAHQASIATTLGHIETALTDTAPGLEEIQRSLASRARPTLDTYNGRAPRKWANDQLGKIRLANPDWHRILTDPRQTFADANANPPTIHWDNTDDPQYATNKLLFDCIFITLPLAVQLRVTEDAERRCSERGDFSATPPTTCGGWLPAKTRTFSHSILHASNRCRAPTCDIFQRFWSP